MEHLTIDERRYKLLPYIFSELIFTKTDLSNIDITEISECIGLSPDWVRQAALSPGRIKIDENNVDFYKKILILKRD